MKSNPTIAYHTLGCKLNFSETSALNRLFNEEGYEKKSFQEEADVYVINTCSVTENADKECRQLIRRVKKQNPDSTVVITGCYAQLQPQQISEIEGVDLVLGASEKFNIVKHVKEFRETGEAAIHSCEIAAIEGFHASYSINDRTRTFLKVQDGCDYNCSFCTIPLARGHSRSDRISGVLDNVKELARSGVQEVVLTGINLGDFGKGHQGNRKTEESFYDLIQALDAFDGIPRYRISSIEPNLLSEEMIAFVSESRHFMPHFHIPLQSGSNTLLASMRRRYRRELYAEKVESIKSKMPHACIGADVIVGYPGESEELFEETLAFLTALDISYVHVFTYSERDNTLAATLDEVVPMQVRKERNARLRKLSELKMFEFTQKHKGQSRPVLFEQKNEGGQMEGYTDNYIRIQRPAREENMNQICFEII